jgi:hypothetical protein
MATLKTYFSQFHLSLDKKIIYSIVNLTSLKKLFLSKGGWWMEKDLRSPITKFGTFLFKAISTIHER